MRCVVWSGLIGALIALGGSPGGLRVPMLKAAPVPVESFAGKTPQGHSPGYTKAAEADRAFAVIDAALKRVWELPDPREPLTELIRVAAEVDPIRACDRVRQVGVQLQKLKLPPARRVAWDAFARAVAPQDRVLRDALLRAAVVDARGALVDPDLWKADPVPPGSMPLCDPQRMRDFEKQQLEYQIRLWQAVLEHRSNRPKSIELTTALLADAKSKGECQLGCISRSYEYDVAEGSASLDADLYLAVVPKVWGKKLVAEMCGGRAYSRWINRQKDSFTEAYAEYAVENGVTRGDVVRIFARYDFPRAWEAVVGLPDDSNTSDYPRRGPMSSLIVMWAWRDPEAALAAAEKEPGKSSRRDLIDVVARVWAQKKPDQIERAVKNQDNAVRKSWARDMAAAESEWRKRGNPPRDTPESAPRIGDPAPAAPAGTAWIPPVDLQKLLADTARVAEADKRLFEMAPHMGQWAAADHAVECVARIKSAHLAANAAVRVARSLIRRAELD